MVNSSYSTVNVRRLAQSRELEDSKQTLTFQTNVISGWFLDNVDIHRNGRVYLNVFQTEVTEFCRMSLRYSLKLGAEDACNGRRVTSGRGESTTEFE